MPLGVRLNMGSQMFEESFKESYEESKTPKKAGTTYFPAPVGLILITLGTLEHPQSQKLRLLIK